ncbi:MAG: hypothetical protein Unbinned1524contig1000_72 [Prokaryotic dsDNA virus sp.]|nr:MAG: hypothetical protein Unbinned1524contig1000_72 [Prokaryotic dsDNA virus sp.]|tara:strand:- start:2119 stop:2526 length:408 start_codon:yes stop_codon:yes gene_type:complete
MCDLLKVWEEAEEDIAAAILDKKGYGARLLCGIKIMKCHETNTVQILNTTLNGDYYQEISIAEYEVFKEKGWRYGIYVLSLTNYRRKLDKIEKKIKKELNGKNNTRAILNAKANRVRIMENFTTISTKLNFIKDE